METKIKWLICSNVCLLLVIGASSLYFWGSNSHEIVYVNSNKLLLEYKGMQTAQAEYEVKAKVWKQQLDTLQQEFQAAIERYELDRKGLSQKENKESMELLERKQAQLSKFQAVVQDKLSQEEHRLQQDVVEGVNQFLKAYGEEKGYEMIMAATTVGNIVYAAEGKDITEDVLAELNKQAVPSNDR